MRTVPDDVFRGLADPTRRAILESLISEGELTVRALTDRTHVSQPMVSKHLGVLKGAGLVRERPEGRSVFYRAEPRGLAPMIDWMKFYRSFWADKFNQLEDLLGRLDQ
jgi:DNA-binding transcriptional ArsR family regulator